MPIEIQDVLKVNIVFAGVGLLSGQDERTAFVRSVDTDVVVERLVAVPVPVGEMTENTESGTLLTLNRDRIRLESVPNRTLIHRDYPTFESLERLAEVVIYAINDTETPENALVAYGYNIDVVYDPGAEVPSGVYLAERLYPGKQFGDESWNLVGGSGRLVFESEGVNWNVTIEPRANDLTGRKIYLSLNLHKDDQFLPNFDEMFDDLQTVWEQAHNFADRLERGR